MSRKLFICMVGLSDTGTNMGMIMDIYLQEMSVLTDFKMHFCNKNTSPTYATLTDDIK